MSYSRNQEPGLGTRQIVLVFVAGVVGIALVVGILFGIGAANRSYDRYQNVADARNEIQVNRMIIEQTEQLVEIEKQKAQIRIEEAYGIAESQEIIDASLTPFYLQYLAIQAQMAMADSPNHSAIFLPVQDGGLPFVYGIEDFAHIGDEVDDD